MTTPDNHNEVSSRFSGMFNDFLTAAKAMEALPTLEAKIRDAEAERDTVKAEANFHRDRVTELGDQITALQSRIAELEASLDKATKSEAASKEALGFLLDAAKSAMKTVEETVELVSPHPAPVADAVGSQQAGDVPVPPTSDAGIQSTGGTADLSQSTGLAAGQSEASPTAPVDTSGTTATIPNMPSADTGIVNPQEAASPDSASGPFASSTGSQLAPVPLSDTTVKSTETPMVSTDTVQGCGSPAQPSAGASPSGRPFAGQPHWHKPNDMSWDNWIAKGGDTPPWLAAKQA